MSRVLIVHPITGRELGSYLVHPTQVRRLIATLSKNGLCAKECK